MRYHKLIIMFLASLLCIPSMLFCQPLSDDEKAWVIRNVIRPEAQMIFLMTIKKDMLDLENLPDRKSEKGEASLSDNEEELKKYIGLNPCEAESFIRLYTIIRDKGRQNESIMINL